MTRSPPLEGELRGNTPPVSEQGGDEEPAFSRGITRQCPISLEPETHPSPGFRQGERCSTTLLLQIPPAPFFLGLDEFGGVRDPSDSDTLPDPTEFLENASGVVSPLHVHIFLFDRINRKRKSVSEGRVTGEQSLAVNSKINKTTIEREKVYS